MHGLCSLIAWSEVGRVGNPRQQHPTNLGDLCREKRGKTNAGRDKTPPVHVSIRACVCIIRQPRHWNQKTANGRTPVDIAPS